MAETRYSATNKEWLSLAEAISTHWQSLLEGQKFAILTDHKPSIGKLKKPAKDPPLLPCHYRWIERLQPFSFKIIHIQGKDNTLADSLSRSSDSYISAIDADLDQYLQDASKKDGLYQKRLLEIEHYLIEKNPQLSGFTISRNLIIRPDNTIEIPNDEVLKTQLLKQSHNDILARHFGRDRTYELLRRKWF